MSTDVKKLKNALDFKKKVLAFTEYTLEKPKITGMTQDLLDTQFCRLTGEIQELEKLLKQLSKPVKKKTKRSKRR